MHMNEIQNWQHTHAFGTDEHHPGERRTRWVIALTFSMMVVEITSGIAFGSMALLAAVNFPNVQMGMMICVSA